MTGTVTLSGCTLTVPSGVLMKVDYNKRWSTTSPTGYLVLDASSSSGANNAYTGNVTVDSYGTATVTVASGVTWTGAYDNANTGKSTSAVINGTWDLSADSYVDTLTNTGTINKNGYTLTVSGTTTNSGTINEQGRGGGIQGDRTVQQRALPACRVFPVIVYLTKIR
jgi:hypothetical protein